MTVPLDRGGHWYEHGGPLVDQILAETEEENREPVESRKVAGASPVAGEWCGGVVDGGAVAWVACWRRD